MEEGATPPPPRELRPCRDATKRNVASDAIPLTLTAAAGGAAALADVAAARRAHLGPAGEAQRGIGDSALVRLDQLRRTGGHGRRVIGATGLRSPGLARRCGRPRLLPGRELRQFLGVDDIPDPSRVLAVQHRPALGDRQDPEITPLV